MFIDFYKISNKSTLFFFLQKMNKYIFELKRVWYDYLKSSFEFFYN